MSSNDWFVAAAGRTLSVRGAMHVVAAARAEAARLDCRVSVVVLDAGGSVLTLVKEDGVTETVTAIAQNKANTALTLRKATADFIDTVRSNELLLAALAGQPGLALIPGGVPVVAGGIVVGAVGVSGGRGDQDPKIAEAAVAALAEE
jgi:glc operon protein GlcG